MQSTKAATIASAASSTPAHWAFGHYLNIAHPSFALPSPPAAATRSAGLALAA